MQTVSIISSSFFVTFAVHDRSIRKIRRKIGRTKMRPFF